MKGDGDFLNGCGCPSEHFLGPVNAEIYEILGGRLAGILLEQSPEFRITYVQPVCDIRHFYAFLYPVIHKVFGSIHDVD